MRALFFLTSLVISFSSLAFAQNDTDSPEKKGRAIAQEADRRDLGWKDSKSELKMVLRNRHGQESQRALRQLILENSEEGRGDKSIVIFDSPRDIEGTALLSHTKILDPDDQWIFLPALKRVKRISSANKSGPFVGSEFAYEDLLSQELDKYSYKWLREEACGSLEWFVVEKVPLYDNSGFTRQIVWWDKGEYRLQGIDFYDRKNSLLKKLHYDKYQHYLNDYWRPHSLKMENLQTGKSTDLIIASWQLRTGQGEGEFTSSRLKHMR